jgi:signal transduction histidine kinase
MLAAQKLESLGVMAAVVAHDFGNLLGAIVAEADSALSEIPADSPVESNLERIAAVASRGSEIVQMLMDFVGGGNAAAALTPLNLSAVVEDLLRLLAPSLSRTAEVRIGLRKDVPLVLGNAAQLQQVVLNLVKNASEALDGRHGSITISTESVSLADANPIGLPAGEYVRLTVADTGCGMSAEACAKIFDPFYTTKPKGRGLGLAAVQGIVRSHGGGISVGSEPGAGTTFEVWFPQAVSAVLQACSCSR